MNAPLETLLSRAGNWSNGELAPVEQYILFIALLKSTDLVKFETAAKPKRNIVVANMPRLLKVAAWVGFMRTKTYLPSYVINEDTAGLSNIHNWLDSLQEAKDTFNAGHWTIGSYDKLNRRQEALERMLKSPTRNEHRFTGLLTDWALTASQADVKLDKSRLEYWTAIFRARGNELANIPLDDIMDVVDYMELHLDSYKGGIFARAALHHIRSQAAKKERGDFFGILDEDIFNFDPVDVLENPFKLLPNDAPQQRNLKQLAAEAPLVKPERENYPNSFSYLRDLAKYNIAARTRTAIVSAVNAVTQTGNKVEAGHSENNDEALDSI